MVFWSGYEYYYQKLAVTPLTSYVPTASMRKGDFSATAADNAAFCGTGVPWVMCTLGSGLTGNLPNGTPIVNGQIPQSAFDPGGVAIMKIIPMPNADPKQTAAGVNYVNQIIPKQNGWIFRTRVDYNFTDNTKLYVSYNAQRQTDEVPAHLWWLPPNSIPFPGGMSSKDNSNTISGRFVHIFGPTVTNEVVATFAYINYPLKPNDPSAASRATLGYPYKGVYRNGDTQIPCLSNGYWTPQPMMDQPNLFSVGGTFVWKKFAPTFEDNLTWVYRTHTMKFGFYYERTANNQGSWSYTNGEAIFYPWGSYTNNTMANLLLGGPSGYWENNFQAITNMSYRTYAAYVMDSWKVARRLTLDLGVRFDHLGPWYDDGNDVVGKVGFAVWVPERFAREANQGIELPGMTWRAREPGVPNTGVPSRFTFVSPRLGVAYDLFGTGKTVLRGGWGAYRWHDSYNDFAGALQASQGARSYSIPYGMSFAAIDAIGLAAKGTLGGLASGAYALNPLDDKQPVTYTYNFTISQRMPWDSLLEIAYVGNNTDNSLLEGSGDYRLQDMNLIPLGALLNPDPITLAPPDPQNANLANYRPYGTRCLSRDQNGVCTATQPGYGNNRIEVTRHQGYSNYNALQVSWNRQKGWATFGLNYTWSKAMGIRGTPQLGGSTGDATNYKNNYGVLSIDRSHVFNASYQFELGSRVRGSKLLEGVANGWTIAGITTWQSGPNLQSLYATNFNVGGVGGGPTITNRLWLGTPDVRLQPILTCDPTTGLKEHQYINGNCFAVPPRAVKLPTGEWQTFNGPFIFPQYIHGPAFFNSDLSVYKTFKITESRNVQFRFSAFNFLNHPLVSFDPNNTTNLNLQFNETSPGSGKYVLANPNFGMADIKLGRRVIALALKFSF